VDWFRLYLCTKLQILTEAFLFNLGSRLLGGILAVPVTVFPPPPSLSSNQCVPVKNTLGWSAVEFCACEIRRLFPVVFRVTIAFHKVDCKGKGNVHPRTCQEGTEGEWTYNYFFNFSARWDGWPTPRPGRFTPGKETRCPLYRRPGGPLGWFGRVRKISPPPVFDPPARWLYRLSYPGPKFD
jgi:hypothetical protein